MTSAKTYHASSLMQELVEATHIAITKAVRIAMFQLFHYWSGRKLNLILKLKVAMLIAQWIHHTFVAYSFVANFVRYISAKYYLNWFSFHTVIMKVLGWTFFETQCICLVYVLPVRESMKWRKAMTMTSEFDTVIRAVLLRAMSWHKQWKQS